MSEANVARGHKANLSNPNTSEESKLHSAQVLEELGQGGDQETSTGDKSSGDQTVDEGNMLRGHKAAISNPRVSEEAKEHSRQVLEDHGAI